MHNHIPIKLTAILTVDVDEWIREYGCADRAEAVGQIIADLHQTLTDLVTTAKWDGLATVSTIDIAVGGTLTVQGSS